MVWCQSLPYIADPDAKVLILGSMPGVRSLQTGQYYAHPQNHFWPLIYTVMELPLPDNYTARCRGLLKRALAVWDVIASCYREGSSDAAITDVTVNDFSQFMADHPSIQLIAFNGGKAAQLWR
ncbi:MAG: DNA-deoxyinosine glycosylase, partial [Methylocystaceae bacterium]